MHLAAYKSLNRACEILIRFVLKQSHSGTKGWDALDKRENKLWRIQILRNWLNMHTQGEDSFTALHFASFHGNLALIRMLIKHGADFYA